MALTLEANYSKKLGLPNFSSHQFSVTIKTEVTDPAQVQGETTRLYGLLQTCVDREMQKTGGLPETVPFLPFPRRCEILKCWKWAKARQRSVSAAAQVY